jgi:hypothetical protein
MGGREAVILLGVAAAAVAPLPSFALARPRSHSPALVHPLPFTRSRSPAPVHLLPFTCSRSPTFVHVHPPSLVPPLVCTPLVCTPLVRTHLPPFVPTCILARPRSCSSLPPLVGPRWWFSFVQRPPSFVPTIVRTLPPLFLPRSYPPTLVRHHPPLFVQCTRSFALALGCVRPSRLLLTLVLWTHPCSCSLLLMVPVQVTSTCCKSIISILILISMLTFLCFPLALWVNNA